jgi:hypothetical protein
MSRLLLVFIVFILAIAAIWAYGRLTSPTPEQEAAIALMQQDTVAEGENGFELMMALPPGPEGGLPASLRCDQRASCIAAIEAQPEASAAAIEAAREHLQAAARALRAPVFRNLRNVGTPGVSDLPPYEPVTSIDALRALQFSSGQALEALDATCTDTLGAVRWATNPDVLIDAMIGIAIVQQNAHLIADMRARAPADPLPPSCTALAEPPDAASEGTMCSALRGEWRYQRRLFPELQRQMEASDEWHWSKPISPLVNDVDWQLAVSAQQFASACSEEARAAASNDRIFAMRAPETRWVDRVAFANSAVLMDIASPAYSDYFERQLDFVAQRRVLSAFLQMEAMPAALSNAERFAALPAALRDGPRPLRLADDGMSVSVPLRSRRYEQNGNEMRLSLPDRAAAATPSMMLEAPTAP